MPGGSPVGGDRADTLWDVLVSHAARRPDAIALEFEGDQTPYAALLNASATLAGHLAAAGIGRGTRVSYLGKNCDRYFTLLYAVARIGAVLVPLNWRLSHDEWAFIMHDAGAAALFSDPELLPAGVRLTAEGGLPPAQIIPHMPTDTPYQSPLPAADDVIFQVYTSGTTGRPKGAMLTHRNMLALRAPGYDAGLAWFPQPNDASLVVLPVAHIAGTAYALFGLYGGGRVVIAREFDPGATLDLIGTACISHVLLAPAAMRLVLDHPAASTTDFGSLRYITYGASPIDEALLTRALATFGCGFVQMYGMTEAAGGVVALTPMDHVSGDATLLRSAGRPMPGVAAAILDAEGAMLDAGEIGEIAIRSDAVMQGYWRLHEATSQTIIEGGWLRTGDIGRMNREGYIFVLDRARDMIVSGGENIYPAEVENAIFGHPDVADVAVIGVPSARWGEEVMAIIVPRPGASPDLASIASWARARIAAFKVPKQLRLTDALPRNAGNKVVRRLLREPFWIGFDRQVH